MSEDRVTEEKKLRQTGNSTGVVLSRRALDAAGLLPDAQVRITAAPGQITITAAGGDHDRTVAAGRAALEQYRYAFEQLGK